MYILMEIDIQNEIELNVQLNNIIDKFVQKYENGPVQGTPEWLAKRCKTVGGSEIHNIVLNPFDSIASIFYCGEVKELILSKIGIKKFNGSVHTRWGNLFEPIIADYFEQTYNTKIKGDEIFIHDVHKYQSYSPDGIAVVNCQKTVTVIDEDFCTEHVTVIPTIALIEFKSPWSRMPNGEIPEHYRCQVLAGLDTVKICDIGLYCEGVFRTCSVKQWSNNNYINLKIHNRDGDAWYGKLPLAFGFVIFYNTTRGTLPDTPDYVCLDEIMDYGKASLDELDRLFYLWNRDNKIKVHYVKLRCPAHAEMASYGQLETLFNEELGKLKHVNVVGILPYKLMHIDVIPVEREHGYVKKHHNKISQVMNIVHECNLADSDYKKMATFNNIFELARSVQIKKNKSYGVTRASSDSSYNDGYDA
jgi:hypothetical protein